MPPKNYIQVKLQAETYDKVQSLVNETNQRRMDAGMINRFRDLIGVATVMRDYFEEGMKSGKIEEFARTKYAAAISDE